MQNKYLKKWNNKFIKNDISSLLLYFDYFSPWIPLPKVMKKYTFARYVFYKLFRAIIVLIFFTWLYKKLYEIVEMDEEFIIKIIGEGNWWNTVSLVKNNWELKIYKKVHSQEIYDKEKLFYNTYSKNSSNLICFPKMSFLDENIIEMEFIQLKTFEKQINEWYFSFQDSINKFFVLKKELQLLYKDNSLIHWDMWDPNIFFTQSWKIYLIDLSDNFEFSYHYDLYVLYKKIHFTYNKLLLTQKIINSIFEEDFLSVLEISKEELDIIEKKYFENVAKKHIS